MSYRLVWIVCVLAAIVVAGCNKDGGKKGAAQPNAGPGPGGTPGKRGPIGEIMLKLTSGKQSLTKVIGDELNADPPPWDKLQVQSKEAVELARAMGKHEPPKGSKESWAKLTGAYTDTAITLDKAVEAKNKDAAVAAHQKLASSCRACHREHRVMGGFPGK
jgi:hypothetical protein